MISTLTGNISQAISFCGSSFGTALSYAPQVFRILSIQMIAFAFFRTAFSSQVLVSFGNKIRERSIKMFPSSFFKNEGTKGKIINQVASLFCYSSAAISSALTTYAIGTLLGYSVSLISLPVAFGSWIALAVHYQSMQNKTPVKEDIVLSGEMVEQMHIEEQLAKEWKIFIDKE